MISLFRPNSVRPCGGRRYAPRVERAELLVKHSAHGTCAYAVGDSSATVILSAQTSNEKAMAALRATMAGDGWIPVEAIAQRAAIAHAAARNHADVHAVPASRSGAQRRVTRMRIAEAAALRVIAGAVDAD